ncbi:glutamyl-tRNA synthetase [Sphingobium sp. SYK-6]|uniref:glutamate--tRNA ligase n=1 Tax=Sphingobium sp. (strain NBRC 103272 / SYK-6) TaxID=627192 RepID=UPI0002277DBE|nr:glutamate--tRNA ligase [Sphingobium sp. SYK-6]BAK68370.1 glutamyl-tRNA synthetase [Sphingobium sp. SYK-6]
MSVITRFAPSPTGKLHVGNIRAALHNWLWARKMGGQCLLRIDDTDTARSEERFVESIRADLAWLGLDMDGEVRQSARFALYEDKFQELRAAGRVYPCFETAQELEIRRKILLGRGLPPVYDRAALALTAEEIAAREAAGETPHWRFRLDHEAAIEWTDLVRGPQHFDPRLLSDPVIRRADGSWLYMLPSVIDDIDMGISHVLRGEDHVSNTATQIQMFAALGGGTPQFAHMALLTGAEGKLSKRLGAIGVSDFRDAGIEPMAINALLARLGTSDPVEPVADVAPLIEHFDFARFGRAPARFSEEELSGLNTRIVHLLPYEAVADRLPAAVTPAIWPVIRPNLDTLAQAVDWLPVLEGDIAVAALGEEDRAFLAQAADMLAQADFSDDPWRALTGALKDATGRKGKALFLPLRLALTGMDHGPDMAALLPIIGKARALDRLRAAAAQVAAD